MSYCHHTCTSSIIKPVFLVLSRFLFVIMDLNSWRRPAALAGGKSLAGCHGFGLPASTPQIRGLDEHCPCSSVLYSYLKQQQQQQQQTGDFQWLCYVSYIIKKMISEGYLNRPFTQDVDPCLIKMDLPISHHHLKLGIRFQTKKKQGTPKSKYSNCYTLL